MKDIKGRTPEIFLCTSNRSAGKTTYFNRLCVRRWLKYGEKFMLVYRFNLELDDCADKFFKDIGLMFFPGMHMISKRRANGMYSELFIDDKPCGYAVALNNADAIKKNSHYFSDVVRMLFDEFQSETNHYCNDEIVKFQSVHKSVARGQGKQSRYVPVFMLSNPVTILNPYFIALGITSRLNENTRFLRGNGWVLEQGYNEAAAKAQEESLFNQAFANDTYQDYSNQAVYLNDNKAFIEKPKGRGRYLATLRYKGRDYALREYAEEGIIYCDDRPDSTFKAKISVTTDDHRINYVMLKSNQFFVENMRYYFDHGCFRFKDLRSKEAILTALSY
jgi:hypothetical protein